MGGTFLEQGNVQEPEHDGTAEWNAFWDPEAVACVWRSKIAINLVALESTNKVPLTSRGEGSLGFSQDAHRSDFIGQCYAICPPLVHFQTNSTYFLWDVLATATIGNSKLVKKRTVYSVVHTSGPSQGRIEAAKEGRPIQLCTM